MLRVKICGITRVEDALAAARAGADAVGFVFHSRSPRAITPEKGRSIARELPPWVARVGVFVDAPADEVRGIAAEAGLTAIQLHGDESIKYIHRLGLAVPVIKAIAMTDGWQERAAPFAGLPLLLDHARTDARGGTGEAWDYARLTTEFRPAWFMLAGGLDTGNVAAAVERLGPDAVDVSTGVESAPGVKDPAKIEAFMRALKPWRGGAKGNA
jgi:phosphoribosylanthranilate isomerase